MAIDRRRLLLGAALLPTLSLSARAAGEGQRFVSARSIGRDDHRLTAFDSDGNLLADLAVPARGHAAAQRPGRAECVLAARRPGTYLAVADLESGRMLHLVDAAPGRRFYGHAVFSPDGRTLFTTENDYEAGRGVLGLYDASDGYRRVGEHSSHGIGPHQLAVMPDGKTLVVANGAILTHPDSGRAKLNVDTMSPSLAYVEMTSGRLLADYRLPGEQHQLSIRHLAVNAAGQVAIGMQDQIPGGDRRPLVALQVADSLRPLDPGRDGWHGMNHYCGSVVFDRSGDLLATSSPRGGKVLFWDRRDGTLVDILDLADVCGLAATRENGRFLVSSGGGLVLTYSPLSGERRELPGLAQPDSHWDNHIVALDL